MMENRLSENLKFINEGVKEALIKSGRSSDEVSVMAVTKTVPYEIVNMAVEKGVSLIGENRVQEFKQKLAFYNFPKEKIHFIGHLQTNKIRDIIDSVSMIESVGSLHLADAISKECEKKGIVMPVLLQVNIGKEETKSGFFKEDIPDALKRISEYKNMVPCGLMAIPPRYSGKEYFKEMQELFMLCRDIKSDSFKTLSMGMSDDYREAIIHGATQVRLGRALFGERQ